MMSTDPQPYYTVKQDLQGDRLYVWVQEDITYDEVEGKKEKVTFTHRYCQHATSNPRKYCKLIAKANTYARKKNARRAALQAVIEKGC